MNPLESFGKILGRCEVSSLLLGNVIHRFQREEAAPQKFHRRVGLVHVDGSPIRVIDPGVRQSTACPYKALAEKV